MVEMQPEMSEKFCVEASAFQAQPPEPERDLFTDLCLRGMLAKAVVLWDQLPGGGPSWGPATWPLRGPIPPAGLRRPSRTPGLRFPDSQQGIDLQDLSFWEFLKFTSVFFIILHVFLINKKYTFGSSPTDL